MSGAFIDPAEAVVDFRPEAKTPLSRLHEILDELREDAGPLEPGSLKLHPLTVKALALEGKIEPTLERILEFTFLTEEGARALLAEIQAERGK